jgi:TFIIF-interacting CTD phosphatase-like protein
MSGVSAFNKLLILDLDETLIFATEAPLDRPADFTAARYFVYRRPGVEAFLADCLAHFTVAVWTASGAIYARQVVAGLLGDRAGELAFLWSSRRCTQRYDPDHQALVTRKPLRKVRRLGYSLDAVLIVDNTPETFAGNYGNAIRIWDFTGDPADDALPRLSRYLHTLGPVPDVRRIEKRGWQVNDGR